MQNVILITIDALRASHLSCMGYTRNTSPFLQKLAQEATIFLRAFSNSCWTAPSFPSILTSDYPVLGNKYGIENRLTLQDILKGSGYQTATLHSNPWLFGHFGYRKSFDYFEDYSTQHYTDRYHAIDQDSSDIEDQKNVLARVSRFVLQHNITYSTVTTLRMAKSLLFSSKYSLPYCDGFTLTTDVTSWLKSQSKEPFFLWIHYMDPHGPQVYASTHHEIEGSQVNKQELKQRLHGITVSGKPCTNYLVDIIKKYDSRIRYTDHAIEKLFAYLQETNTLDKSLIIITADHGEEFFDHGSFGHSPKLYDELIHVPLIVKGPGIPRGKQSVRVVQNLDIAPTILDILGLSIPKSFLGENLFEDTDRQGIISEVSNETPNKTEINLKKLKVAYRTRDWKYIHSVEGNDELYNLEEDPREKRNLILERHDKAEEYMQEIHRHLSQKKLRYQYLEEKERNKTKVRKLKNLGKI